jgi:hypothetical protein
MVHQNHEDEKNSSEFFEKARMVHQNSEGRLTPPFSSSMHRASPTMRKRILQGHQTRSRRRPSGLRLNSSEFFEIDPPSKGEAGSGEELIRVL